MIALDRMAGSLGAEVRGVDLSGPLSDALIAELRAAWLEHLVLFFPGQRLGPGQFLAFAERLGRPIHYPFLRGLPEFPLITEVRKLPHERTNFGGVWHSDTAYLARPPMASLLLAREVPPVGGDTLFSNQYLALEALSPGMRDLLHGLRAVNSSAKADASRTREDLLKTASRDPGQRDFLAEHPIVRTHPETGRQALYVNVAHTVGIAGLTDEESAPLLAFLFAHQNRPEFTCRVRWQPGALALWDNRCTQHNPVNDYHGHLRVMHRITLEGDIPC